MATIVLAGQSYDIAALPFGKLRKLIGFFNVMSTASSQSEAALAQSASIFALLLDKTVDEIDAMPITVEELGNALEKIPEMCGLVKKPSGEATAGPAATVSTESTAT